MIDAENFVQNLELLAGFNLIEEILPYKQYPSGTKDGESGVWVSTTKNNDNSILILENDVVDSFGLGLKKGFYEVKPDSNFDFLLLLQSNNLKAKIPIVSIEQIDENPPKEKRMSEKAKKRKYKRGKDPADFLNSKAELLYDKDNGYYVLFWELKNTKIIGIMRLK